MFNLRKIDGGNGRSILLMGVINASPDSYYKTSIATDYGSISKRAKDLEKNGADIIDIGGMSTAPNLQSTVSLTIEKQRLSTAIEAVKHTTKLPISVDTPRSEVAKLSIDLGADIINDITGLNYDKHMAKVAYESGVPVILGAFNGNNSTYESGDIPETLDILRRSIEIAHDNMISDENLIIDPSIGFFRKECPNQFFTKIRKQQWYERDLNIISNLEELGTLSKPVCISVSNKSFIGHIFDLALNDRLVPSLIFELLCYLKGANIIRTHNLAQLRQAIKTLNALPEEVIGKWKLSRGERLSTTIDSSFTHLLERFRRKRL
ncbi:MAG TPA: dihydropteroate synthase [Nitrososphaeraceae archaeon]|jgi:dihydropteroate synthase